MNYITKYTASDTLMLYNNKITYVRLKRSSKKIFRYKWFSSVISNNVKKMMQLELTLYKLVNKVSLRSLGTYCHLTMQTLKNLNK